MFGEGFTSLLIDSALNSLPDGEILAWSKLLAFAVDKLQIAEMVESVFDREENIMGKGENAGNHIVF